MGKHQESVRWKGGTYRDQELKGFMRPLEKTVVEILPFATTWMELDGVTLSKISETEKDKYSLI